MGQTQGGFCGASANDVDKSNLPDEVGVTMTGELPDDKTKFCRIKTPMNWTHEQAAKLQEVIDVLFSKDHVELLGLEYSFTIADPHIQGCPLVGCSTGFTKLVGYGMSDIVGQNCRFLVDPVPKEQIDVKARKHAREFCEAVVEGRDYFVPDDERENWMPKGRPGDEILCFQRNARKDGTLFWNMFYMKTFHVGTSMDALYPYIIGLQSELPDGKATLSELGKNLTMLDQRMTNVTTTMSKFFFTETAMRRDQEEFEKDGFAGFDIGDPGSATGEAIRAF